MRSLAEGLQAEIASTGVSASAVAAGSTATGFAARATIKMGTAATPDVVSRVAQAGGPHVDVPRCA